MNKEHKVSLFPSLYKYESEETTLEEIIILIRRRRWVREKSPPIAMPAPKDVRKRLSG